MGPGLLLIRAHAGPRVGTGHVMRCLALAQAWKARGGTVHFRLGREGASLEGRLNAEGMETSIGDSLAAGPEDARDTAECARMLGARAAVVDGYPFTGGFQQVVRSAAGRLLVIDDNGESSPYAADLILNQNAHADPRWYRDRPGECVLMLGARYVLLRREFLSAPPRAPSPGRRGRNVLVTLGGGDPDNVTLKAVRALQRSAVPVLRAKVVVGALNPNIPSLEAAIRERPGVSIELVRDARDMPGLMAWADLAIAAAGSTVWELSYMGLPALIVTVAENQRGIAESLHAAGAAQALGWHADVGEEAIIQALERNWADPETVPVPLRLVDGLGGARVAAALAGEDRG